MQAHLVRMMQYHRWASGRAVKAVRSMGDAQTQYHAGLPFFNAVTTLYHIALADVVWMSRIRDWDKVPEAAKVGSHRTGPLRSIEDVNALWQAPLPQVAWPEASPDLGTVHQAQVSLCDAWDALLADMSDDDLQQPFTYHNTRGEEKSLELGAALAHVVNHGTHHRGQLSPAVMAVTGRYPVMDFLYFLDEHA